MKAFDRFHMWSKLAKVGIRGRMLNIIQSLYVKHSGDLSEYLTGQRGVLQSDVPLPILFSLFINDCQKNFIKTNPLTIELQMISLVLICADDMVIRYNLYLLKHLKGYNF